jgi:hypothetical protein
MEIIVYCKNHTWVWDGTGSRSCLVVDSDVSRVTLQQCSVNEIVTQNVKHVWEVCEQSERHVATRTVCVRATLNRGFESRTRRGYAIVLVGCTV